MEKPPRLSFLSLPPELRLEVYKCIYSSIDTSSLWLSEGFYRSCRQVKVEMDGECIKKRCLRLQWQAWQAHIYQGKYKLRLEVRHSFSGVQNLTLCIPASYLPRSGPDPSLIRIALALARLTHLLLESITFKISFDLDNRPSDHRIASQDDGNMNFNELIKLANISLDDPKKGPRWQRIVYDISNLQNPNLDNFIYGSKQLTGWQFWTFNRVSEKDGGLEALKPLMAVWARMTDLEAETRNWSWRHSLESQPAIIVRSGDVEDDVLFG